jgi:hypothetical protein
VWLFVISSTAYLALNALSSQIIRVEAAAAGFAQMGLETGALTFDVRWARMVQPSSYIGPPILDIIQLVSAGLLDGLP